MESRALRTTLQLGLLGVAAAALPYKPFELDRYFVPKELVMHIAALFIAAQLFARRRALAFDRVDALLAFFVMWSALSSIFATNYWLAQRALGVTVSSAIVFWGARRASRDGHTRSIFIAASLATVLVALGEVAQTYGLRTEYFSINRAPGGLLGNRNFVAHVAAIGLPVTIWCGVTARRRSGAVMGALAVGILSGALVLSRSRAGWLAIAASLIMLAVPVTVSRKYWSSAHIGGRLSRMLLTGVVAAIMAIVLPNSLNWNSESPYLDSARGMVNYSRGSGFGRVAQYSNSLRMAAASPVFGEGPGNWPVHYVRFAPRGDRSLADDGTTANPWPSGDWVAFMSERGFVAAAALLVMFALIFLRALRGWRALSDTDAVLAQIAVAGTIVATLVVSAFDVALLLPTQAFLIWSVLGAGSGNHEEFSEIRESPKSHTLSALALLLVLALSMARSATQLAAMANVGFGGLTAGWVRGATWDPGSYRINMRVAELYLARGKCSVARAHARRAAALLPLASPPRRIIARCGR